LKTPSDVLTIDPLPPEEACLAPRTPDLAPLPEEKTDRLNVLSEILPIEHVRVAPRKERPWANKVMLYSIHGGDVVPEAYLENVTGFFEGRKRRDREVMRTYAVEKDWGANQIAHHLAAELGTGGYWRVNIARALLDFGRFPGITTMGASHLDRYAINYPFSHGLDFTHKRTLLESCYDFISDQIERATMGKIIKLGIHTYDHRNPTHHLMREGTVRPELSIIYRSASFQHHKHMPIGLFDPLYPDMLAEYTADRKLTSRISLMMEKSGVAVSNNFPYLLPDGSVEVRAQVWIFFDFLSRLFRERFPETASDPTYQMVWTMLLDTNLRRSESEALRSFLHMFRNAPKGRVKLFRGAQHAYEHIHHFLEENRGEVMEQYRFNPNRLSSFALEVRKDIVWNFNDHHTWDPVYGAEGVREHNVRHLASLMAASIAIYMEEDRSSNPPFNVLS